MPIYLYRPTGGGCEKCSGGLEVLQQIGDELLAECPHCGAAIHRVPAAFAPGKGSLLGSASLKAHGFKKLRRTDKGGYEDVT